MNYQKICLQPFRRNDLTKLFSKAYFSFLFENVLGLNMSEHHRDMANKLLNEDNKQVFLQAARGHGKSEEVSVAYPIYLLLTKGSNSAQPYQICLVSSTESQMRKLMQRIKNYIEATSILRELLYPNKIHEAKWNESELITKNNVQLIGKPMGSSIRGLHVQMAILDDVLTDESADVEGAKEIFKGVISPIVRTKKGRMVVVGTPMSFDDLFADLFDKDQYPTAVTGFYPARLADGNPLWSDRFSREELDLIEKNMGPIKWAREYMLQPIGAGAMLFDEALVMGSVSKDQVLNKYDETQYFLGCDIALSSSKSANYSVFIVIEKNPKTPLRVVEIWREQGVSTNDQINIIKNLHRRYNFSKICIEKIGLSYGMVEELEIDDVTRSVIEPFVTNQRNKEDILSRLHVLMKNKQLLIPNDDNLIKELLTFGIKKKKDGNQTYETLGKHDDMVMALSIACYGADQFNTEYDFEWV